MKSNFRCVGMVLVAFAFSAYAQMDSINESVSLSASRDVAKGREKVMAGYRTMAEGPDLKVALLPRSDRTLADGDTALGRWWLVAIALGLGAAVMVRHGSRP
jgi:hypothetical protein